MIVSNKMSVQEFGKLRDAYCKFYRDDQECNCPHYCIYDYENLDDALDVLTKFVTDSAVTYKQLLEVIFPTMGRYIIHDYTPSELFDTESNDWEDIIDLRTIHSIKNEIEILNANTERIKDWTHFLEIESYVTIGDKLNKLFNTDIF